MIAKSLLERISAYIKLLRFTPFDLSTEAGRSNERYRLIALSSFSSLFAKFFTSFLGLITVPLTINYLGKEQFGLWMIVSSLIVWLQLADFGVSNGLTNALAEANGRDDKKAAICYISTAVFATLAITTFLIVPIWLTSYLLPWDSILNLKESGLEILVGNCFLVAGLIFVLNLPLAVVNRVFLAYQLGYLANLTQIFASIIALVGLIFSIQLKLNLPMLVGVISIAPIIGNLIAWVILLKKMSWIQIRLGFVTWNALKRVANSSIPMFIYLTGSMLTCQFNNIIIAQVGSLSMVADYNILVKIYMTIFVLGVSFSTPFYAAIREAFERKEANWVVKSITRALKIRLAVIGVPAILLLFCGDWLIKIWVRKPLESPFGISGWLFFVGCMALYTFYSTISEILVSLDQIWMQNFLLIGSSLIALICQYYLIPVIGLKAFYMVSSLTILIPIICSVFALKRVMINLKDKANE